MNRSHAHKEIRCKQHTHPSFGCRNSQSHDRSKAARISLTALWADFHDKRCLMLVGLSWQCSWMFRRVKVVQGVKGRQWTVAHEKLERGGSSFGLRISPGLVSYRYGALSINTQHSTACQQRHIPKRGHARLSQGSLQSISLVPLIFIVSLESNLYFLCSTATRLDSLSIRASDCKFAIFSKVSLSLCTRPETDRPTVQPAAELRAPVAVVPRTTGRQKFEST